MKIAPTRLLLVLSMISAAGIATEIIITRLFSLYFQYNFAFLAISLAVLGLSLGAAWASFSERPTLATALLTTGILYPLVALAIAFAPSATLTLLALLSLLPFVGIGLISARLFAHFGDDATRLYAADLVGAAVGIVTIMLLLNWMSAFSALLLAGVVMGIGGWLVGRGEGRPKTEEGRLESGDRGLKSGTHDTHYARRTTQFVTVITAILTLANLFTNVIDYQPARLSQSVRDKTMLAILADPSQQAEIVATQWSPFARVDVVATSDPNAKFVFADGGAGSYMLRFDGNLQSVERLRREVEFVPFDLRPPANVLVIGAGAGKDVTAALLAGAKAIRAVEVNPAIVDLTRAAADYNGGIFDRPEVTLHVGDARTFVERSVETFDLVYLNVVYSQVANPSSQALVESYIFTEQAMHAYWQRLSDDGVLAIIAHNGLEGSRAALTALTALDQLGIKPADALDHIALWMLPNEDPTLRTSLFFLSKQPFTSATIAQLVEKTGRFQMQPLFVPGQFELAFAGFRKGQTLDDYIESDAGFDLAPVSDDSPFFFKLDPGLPAPVSQAMLIAGALALLVLGLGLAQGRQTAQSQRGLVGVALLGVGFMLVEIPLIQRFHLLLGYPIWSLATVLGSLLLAGGVGSLLGGRWLGEDRQRRVRLSALAVCVLALFYWLALPSIISILLPAPLAMRWLATVLLTVLLGLPMGIPFANLMAMAHDQPRRLALLWSINGACSVFGSTLAMVLAMSFGFSWALLIGAGFYAILVGMLGIRAGSQL